MIKALSSWAFIQTLLYCECEEHYGHKLFNERWIQVMFFPRPVVVFDYWECDAAWVFYLGWFRVDLFKADFQKERNWCKG